MSRHQPEAPANRAALLWWAAAAAGAALVVGLVGVAVANSTSTLSPLQPTTEGVVRAVRLSDESVAMATAQNKILIARDGALDVEKQLPSLVTGLTVTTGSPPTLAAGTVTGEVLWLDRQLHELRSFKVPARITALSPTPSGGVFVTYGSGNVPQYNVDAYDAEGNRQWSRRVGFPTTDLVTVGDLVVYGNSAGNIGAIGPDGNVAWTGILQQPVARLIPVPGQRAAIAGDSRGTVYMLAENGTIRWRQQVSEFRVESIAVMPDSDLVLAGTSNGWLYALGSQGEHLWSTQLAASNVVEIVPLDGNRAEAIAKNGFRTSVNAASIRSAEPLQRLQLVWMLVPAALVLATVALLVAALGRMRAAVALTSRRAARARMAYLLLVPSLALIAVFSFYPAGMAFYYAFTDFSLSRPMQFVGLRNFEFVAQDLFFWVGMKNMVILLVANVLKEMTMPLIVAELIFWMHNSRARYWFRTAFLLPAIVPGVVLVLIWRTIYAPNIGLINQTLLAVGLGHLRHSWLAEDATALGAIIFTGFPWVGIFAFLIYLGGLLSINREVLESASVDGAGWFTRFRRIEAPMLTPQFRVILFFTFVGSIQGFAHIFILTGGGPGSATYVPALEMFIKISQAAEFGTASAIGFILSAMVLLLVFFRLRFEREEAT